jgi:hypothetical protein
MLILSILAKGPTILANIHHYAKWVHSIMLGLPFTYVNSISISGYPRPSVKNFDIKKMKKNNTKIGPVKWNCLVHTNKIVPKKKRKGGKKKTVMKTTAKISPPKKKINNEIFSLQFNRIKNIDEFEGGHQSTAYFLQ